MGKTMMPRFGLTIDIALRELPFCIIAAGGAALGIGSEVPAAVVIPAAFLVAMRVRISFRDWKRPRF
ncbi:hypothetical protein [Streptomyces atacamensis]|uniref:hypothetical protein n=1 Tax=Streptomyces atacamensis TaxID=531966 RepID=UPI0021845C0E|nr:hypothetical protein LUW77_14105 [Streptomyces radiopugnans]